VVCGSLAHPDVRLYRMRHFVRGFIFRRGTKNVRHKRVLVQIGFLVLVCEKLGESRRRGSNKRCTQRCRYSVGVVVGVVMVVVMVMVIDDGDAS